MYRDARRDAVICKVVWSRCAERGESREKEEANSVKDEAATLDYRTLDAVGTTESYTVVSRDIYP